jgi:hypothetical protein
MNALEVIEGLPGYRKTGQAQAEARCPAHDDKKPSLSIGRGHDGKILLHCQAGCELQSILKALNLEESDLFPERNGKAPTHVYQYLTPGGKLAYEVLRFHPKDFRQRRPDGAGGYIWNLKDQERLLYHLPAVVKADYVFVVEGEKDADALAAIGLTATCNSGGAGSWQESLARFFDPRQHVTVIPDNDPPGRAHALAVCKSLKGKVASLKLLPLPGLPDKGDVSDWLAGKEPQAANEELSRLAEAAPEWTPTAATTPTIPPTQPNTQEFSYIEFAPTFLAIEDPPVQYLVSELLPEGIIALMHGEPRARKSWGVLEIAIALATGTCAFGMTRFSVPKPVPVLYSSQEDTAPMVRIRAKAILKGRGITHFPETLAFSVHKGINLESDEWQQALLRDVVRYGFSFVAFDPIRRYSPNVDKGPSEVRTITAFLRRICVETGASVCPAHHDVKPPSNDTGSSRRRGHKASGGDWFAAAECPIAFERVSEDSSLVVPEDYKFSVDPQPFTFTLKTDDPKSPSWARLLGESSSADDAKYLEIQSKIIEYLSNHSCGASGSEIAKSSRARREDIYDALERLFAAGVVDCVGSGGKGKKRTWFLRGTETDNQKEPGN